MEHGAGADKLSVHLRDDDAEKAYPHRTCQSSVAPRGCSEWNEDWVAAFRARSNPYEATKKSVRDRSSQVG